MTGEEQSVLSALVAAKQYGGFIGWIASGVIALLAWLGVRVYRGVIHDINNAKQAASAASALAVSANKERVDNVTALHVKIDGHILSDATSHNALMEIALEQTKMLGTIHVDLQKALGERPTRAEVRDMISLHGKSR